MGEMARLIGRELNPTEFAKFWFDFEPFAYQKDALNCNEKRVVLNWGRQAGKTEITAIRGLYEALTKDDILVLIVSPSQSQSRIVFDKMRKFLNISRRRLPELGLQDLIVRETRLQIEFFNGSRIISLPGNPDTIRGYTASFIIVDESSRVDEAIYPSITPMLSTTNGTLFLISTPNGVNNTFYRAYSDPKMGYKTFYSDSFANPKANRDMIEKDKERLPIGLWEQEYLAKFVDETTAFFPISLIESCMDDTVRREAPIEHARYILAIDPAGSGESETVFMVLEKPASIETPRIVKIDERRNILPNEIVNYAAFLHRFWNFSKIMIDATGHGTALPSFMDETFKGNPHIEAIEFSYKSKEEIFNNAKILMQNRKIKIPKMDKLRKQMASIQFEHKQNYTKIWSDELSDYVSAFVIACYDLANKKHPSVFWGTARGTYG